MISKQNKKAAVEMSVGTIVTIVLLMTVLILGLVLVRTIFTSSTENINSIDQAVKNEINKLFSEDDSRTIVIYPPTRSISIKQGEEGGFGFSIRNTGGTSKEYDYDVIVASSEDINCGGTQGGMSTNTAEELIILGRTGTNIVLGSGNSLENPILVRFSISEDDRLCNIRYTLTVDDGFNPQTVTVDLEILPE